MTEKKQPPPAARLPTKPSPTHPHTIPTTPGGRRQNEGYVAPPPPPRPKTEKK